MSVNAPFVDVIFPFNVNFSRFFSIFFTFWIVVNCIFMLGTRFAPSKVYDNFSFNVCCFIPNNIIGFMFENFAMKPCYLLLNPVFCVVYSQDILTVNI